MVRTPAAFALLGAAALAACGGGGSSSKGSTTTATSSKRVAASSGSATSLGSTTGAGGAGPASASPLSGCTVPTTDVTFGSGSATVEVTSGPGKGRFDLTVQPRSRSEYQASTHDLKGEWRDAADQLLFLNLSGSDPCQPGPSAFVRIEAEGATGPAFADSARKRCQVELKAFSGRGVDGSFTCTQLGGGGAGVYIDATGTFSLRA